MQVWNLWSKWQLPSVELAAKIRASVQQKISESVVGDHSSTKVIDQDLLSKVTEMQLVGTKVVKKVFGPKGSLYVLVGLDEAGAMELKNAIAAEYLLRQRR
jgi:ABC-type nitrate/sulfonate/bicarbonate transport system permease component